jgi:CRP-like cAMP-binding protein
VNINEADLKKTICSLFPVQGEELTELLYTFTPINYPAKKIIIEQNQVSDQLYFVSKGCMRSYYIDEKGREVTLWLGHEGDFITCFRSWLTRKPGHETIELVEDCKLYSISYTLLQKYAKKYPGVNSFYRLVIEDGFLYWEKRAYMLLFTSARERYDDLITRYPLVMNRWPLGHIASYLGITQETLSRLRAEK